MFFAYACRLIHADDSGNEDEEMDDDDEQGWSAEHTQWWFDFLTEKGGKGVSKDTWAMVRLLSRARVRLAF